MSNPRGPTLPEMFARLKKVFPTQLSDLDVHMLWLFAITDVLDTVVKAPTPQALFEWLNTMKVDIGREVRTLSAFVDSRN